METNVCIRSLDICNSTAINKDNLKFNTFCSSLLGSRTVYGII